MEKIKKILAPTDLSELSCTGVRHALEMASPPGAEVILYHVIDVGEEWFARREEFAPYREMLARRTLALDKFLRETFPDYINLVEVRQVVELGVPSNNIVEKAEHEGVDMIVMSTHGRTGLDHMLMGSVTEKVVARAPCPVLAIPARKGRAAVAKAA